MFSEWSYVCRCFSMIISVNLAPQYDSITVHQPEISIPEERDHAEVP